MNEKATAYNLAQRAISDPTTTVCLLLNNSEQSLSNAEIGRALGIYHGHSGKHEGHISRVLLELMKVEGLIIQDIKNKKWSIK